jgi:hypothetical protein
MQSTDRLQEESVMTWSDSHWVLLYSVLITLFIPHSPDDALISATVAAIQI